MHSISGVNYKSYPMGLITFKATYFQVGSHRDQPAFLHSYLATNASTTYLNTHRLLFTLGGDAVGSLAVLGGVSLAKIGLVVGHLRLASAHIWIWIKLSA